MTVEYEGKEYYADKEDSYISCKGCVFEQTDVDSKWCACTDDKMKQDCCSEHIVWKEVSAPMFKKTKDEEPKFTVEQVLLAVGNYLKQNKPLMIFDYHYKPLPGVTAAITSICYFDDPDYKLYLELKSKYES